MPKKLLLLLAAVVVPGISAAQVRVHVAVPEVRVRIAPPAARVEVRPERPSPRHEWAAGHWAWRNNSNVWIGGVWATPPRDGMVWEDARWNERNGRWYYAEGYWRWAGQPSQNEVYEPSEEPEAVVVEQPPPRRIAEVRSGRPFRGAVWIDGYWHWNGANHVWVAGRWSAPRSGSVWTRDHWTRDNARGHDGRWVLARGHWSAREAQRRE